MSVYLKVLPAVMLEPDILLNLGQKITSIVRESLILDRRMEEICTALEREGRTLQEVIERNNTMVFTGEIEEAAIASEKACSLFKAVVQLLFLQQNEEYSSHVQLLYETLEKPGKISNKTIYSISSERIRDIVEKLDTEEAREAIVALHMEHFFEDLKSSFDHFETVLFECRFTPKTEQLPTIRSSIALYGMLLDTLIVNVRFENYQLLHRVQSVLSRIETVVTEAVAESVSRQKDRKQFPATIEQALA